MILLGAAGHWPASVTALDCYREIDPYYWTVDIPSMIHIASPTDAVRVRTFIRNYIWRQAPWPTRLPDEVRSVYEAGGGPGYVCVNPVDPPAIPGLALWLDAADTSTVDLDGERAPGRCPPGRPWPATPPWC